MSNDWSEADRMQQGKDLVNFTIYQEIQKRMEDQQRRDEAKEYRKEEHKRRLEQELIAERKRSDKLEVRPSDYSE